MAKSRVHMKKVLNFLLCHISLSFVYKSSCAADTLTPKDSIRDGQEITSFGESFALGFFAPGSSKGHYMGIWYKNIMPQTVIWVANREKPLNDSQGQITIGADGNIVLLDGTGNIEWSTNSTRAIQEPIAKLLDSGNLVLVDGDNGDSGSYIWQSFDFPSHTLIPGMKVGWDKISGLNRQLISWKSADNPSIGKFSYGFVLTPFPYFVLREGLYIRLRSGMWNGKSYNSYNWESITAFRPVITMTSQEASYMDVAEDNIITRFVLSDNGLAERFIWDNQTLNWSKIYEARKDSCDYYAYCGANSICNISNVPGYCDCLRGFIPKSQEEWRAFHWTSGCTRRTPLNCTQGDRFQKLSGVKLPMFLQFWTNNDMSLEDCRVECLKNCSCTAYANSAINGGLDGCLIWFGDLIDMRVLINEDGKLQDLYVRLAASEVDKGEEPTSKSRKRIIMALIISTCLGMLLFCSIMYIVKKNRESKITRVTGNRNQSDEQNLPLIDIISVLAATNNFSRENKIGEGGFGPVYKGRLAGEEIAVKRLSKTSKQGIREFMNEVGLVAKLQHRNLVRVLGGCIQGEERMLVYEYMPNRSMDQLIFDPTHGKILDWRKRYDIIMGIARGLLYLHQDSRLNIIHRDLKTSNILLDTEFNPKISDFGMAHIFDGSHSAVKTEQVAGTRGYISPEYAKKGLFSVKSDVFSFGVVVLEILSGIKNNTFNVPDQDYNLLRHAWISWKEGRILEFMDVNLCLMCIPSELMRCLQVGLLCVQDLPEDRPNMLSVVFMLGNESRTVPQPKEVGFYKEKCPEWRSEAECCSNNSMTVTVLEART